MWTPWPDTGREDLSACVCLDLLESQLENEMTFENVNLYPKKVADAFSDSRLRLLGNHNATRVSSSARVRYEL